MIANEHHTGPHGSGGVHPPVPLSGVAGVDVSALPVKYCGAPTLNGGVCKQVVGVNGSGHCIHHDPARAVDATAMRRRGALAANSREPQPDDLPAPGAPKTLADVIAWHSWITATLASGQIDKATATGLAYNLQQLRGALVSRDLEKEVEGLRSAIADLKRRGAGR